MNEMSKIYLESQPHLNPVVSYRVEPLEEHGESSFSVTADDVSTHELNVCGRIGVGDQHLGISLESGWRTEKEEE